MAGLISELLQGCWGLTDQLDWSRIQGKIKQINDVLCREVTFTGHNNQALTEITPTKLQKRVVVLESPVDLTAPRSSQRLGEKQPKSSFQPMPDN
jgi:hypothetical protein